jgi:hypothetical protein
MKLIAILFGIILILHGLVHLLYAGQSLRRFELRPGMLWPDGSWLFSKFPGDDASRLLAGILLVLATLGFVVAGLGLFLMQDWWRTVTVCAALLSTVIYISFWDGKLRALDNKGGIGVLINLAILVMTLMI